MLPGMFVGPGVVGETSPITLTYNTRNAYSGTNTALDFGSPNAGDLLLYFGSVRKQTSIGSATYGSGFTALHDTAHSGTYVIGKSTESGRMMVAYKIASGSEGSSVSGFTTCDYQMSVAFRYVPNKPITSVTLEEVTAYTTTGVAGAGQNQTTLITEDGTTHLPFHHNSAKTNSAPTVSPSDYDYGDFISGSVWGGWRCWHEDPGAHAAHSYTAARNLLGHMILTGYIKVT